MRQGRGERSGAEDRLAGMGLVEWGGGEASLSSACTPRPCHDIQLSTAVGRTLDALNRRKMWPGGSAVGTALDALNHRKTWPAGPAVGTALDALIMASGFCLFLGLIRWMFFIVICCDDFYYSIAC